MREGGFFLHRGSEDVKIPFSCYAKRDPLRPDYLTFFPLWCILELVACNITHDALLLQVVFSYFSAFMQLFRKLKKYQLFILRIFGPVWNKCSFATIHSVWKSPKMSHLNFSILVITLNFCPIEIDLSGYSVWPQTSVFKN